MSVWEKYPESQQKSYVEFLKVYGALSNLFKQKQANLIPYLDSKFQETIYARVFKSKNVDTGNTPHDILSILEGNKVGIGLKTWMKSTPSYQKVMQIKRYKDDINKLNKSGKEYELACEISFIKNERLLQDYHRLGLSKNSNIYHYITRDENKFTIQECSYPLIDLNNLKVSELSNTSLLWSDGLKDYKYTFADSQIYMKFDSNREDTLIVQEFDIEIIDDPFDFLLKAYSSLINEFNTSSKKQIEVAYLPLYSYRDKKVPLKAGLNAWNSASKTKGSDKTRPDREIYIQIPAEFHKKNPDFFTDDISKIIKKREDKQKINKINKENGITEKTPYTEDEEVRFTIVLPNGSKIPGSLRQERLKAFQSGSKDKKYGQSDLGNWLLNEVLDLKVGEIVTCAWLEKKETDSLKIWHEDGDKETIYIDFAPIGSFEKYMKDEEVED